MMKSRSLNDIFEVPSGISDLGVSISSSSDLDLYLYAPSESKYIVQKYTGIVNNKTHSGKFQNLQVTFSGDAGSSESLMLQGETQTTFQVRVENFGAQDASATITFNYSSINPCPEVPVGCDQYDHLTAQQEVLAWSKGIASRYSNCEDIWYNVVDHAIVADLGVGWHKWSSVWSQLDEGANGGSSAESWQLGFAFLDHDRSGYVSKEEFILGCTLYKSQQMLVGSSDPVGGTMGATGGSSGEQVAGGKTAETAPPTPAATTAPAAEATTTAAVSQQCSDAVGCFTCPDGYYRTSAILLPCESSSGSTCVIIQPQQLTEVDRIPAGVSDLHITLKTDAQADLSLYDPTGNGYVVQKDSGVVSDAVRSSSYQGVDVAFSGDDAEAPTSETIDIQGATPTELYLRVRNFGEYEAWALLEHSHDGVTPCPNDVPLGCELFDSDEAVKQVSAWTSMLKERHGDVDTAWKKIVPNPASTGVSWYQWEEVWNGVGDTKVDQNMQNTWQLTFALLDKDNDCVVSDEEFRRSFRKKFGYTSDANEPGEVAASGNSTGKSRSFLAEGAVASHTPGLASEPAIERFTIAQGAASQSSMEASVGLSWWVWALAAFCGGLALILLSTSFAAGVRYLQAAGAWGATADETGPCDTQAGAEDLEGDTGARDPLLQSEGSCILAAGDVRHSQAPPAAAHPNRAASSEGATAPRSASSLSQQSAQLQAACDDREGSFSERQAPSPPAGWY